MPLATTLSSTGWRRGRRSAALLLLVVGMTLAGLWMVGNAHANPNQMIGLDMTPVSDNSPSSAGVDTCAQVDVGASFEADVFATNLTTLTHFELRVDFDPKILSLDSESIDFNFLLAKDGGSAQFPVVEEEKPGRWFIGAADTRQPDSGSGTLARLTFKALKNGTSTVSIAANPVVVRPILEGRQGLETIVRIGDDNGDGFWDGGLSAGKVAVGVSCAGATPIVTPGPTNVPNTTPKPGSGSSTPAPTGDASQPTDTADDSDSPVRGAGGSGDEPTDTSLGIVGNVGSGGGQSSPTRAPGNVQNPSDDGGNGEGDPNQNDSGGSSSSLTIVLIAIGVALVAAAGTVLVWLRIAAAGRYTE